MNWACIILTGGKLEREYFAADKQAHMYTNRGGCSVPALKCIALFYITAVLVFG